MRLVRLVLHSLSALSVAVCVNTRAAESGKAALVPAVKGALSRAGLVGPSQEAATAARHSESLRARPLAADEATKLVQQPESQARGLIIRFRSDEAKRRARANAPPPDALIAEIAQLAGTELRFVRAMSMDNFVFRFAAPLPLSEAQTILARIRSLPAVEHVEPDVAIGRMFTPNESAYALYQWNLMDPARFAGSANVAAAWDVSRGAYSTVIAVIDTGVRPNAEFGSRLLPGYDFISDPFHANDGGGRDADASDPGDWQKAGECAALGSPEAADSSWHGTHVAGIIAAAGNNSAGIAGVTWNSRILPVRVLGKCGGELSDIIDAMLWAAGIPVPGVPANPYPAQIINLSLGGPSPGGCEATSYPDAINQIKARGALITVAAGNDDSEAASYVPGSCDGVITVGAVGPDGQRASYSNYSFQYKVSISAPGGDGNRFGTNGAIYSLSDSGLTTPRSPAFDFSHGTSMAAPHVAGIAALGLAVDPQVAPELLQLTMELTARDFPASGDCATLYPLCGSGIVDAANTLAGINALKPYLLVYEFYNVDLNHYFRTGERPEATFVLTGGAGAGWRDTQDYFLAWRDGSQGAVPVCRFYGTPGVGPNSHFYTADPAECAFVKKDPGWTYEGIAFYAKLPAGGQCPAGTMPIHRLYNNRWMFNDSNHRFTTEPTVVDAMVAQGWIREGITMCAFGGGE